MTRTICDEFLLFKKRLLKTAAICCRESCAERPELTWLKKSYEALRKKYGLEKAAMDALLYERIFGAPPSKPSDTIKIRYWRTGQHYPVSRELCAAFAHALELNEEERLLLLLSWMDKSADLYTEPPSGDDDCYRRRLEKLSSMISGYFHSRFPDKKTFSFGAFRHCYYLDALKYVHPEDCPIICQKNIHSINYDSELKRTLMLLGEIPRKTMLRHLILLNLPELTVNGLSEDLQLFGYLPLNAEHTLTGGERLDRLVIESVRFYEIIREKYGSAKASVWFLKVWQELDAYFISKKKSGFRLFYFKSLGL